MNAMMSAIKDTEILGVAMLLKANINPSANDKKG